MTSHRGSLLGQHPSTTTAPAIQNVSLSRRAPLLPAGPPGLTTPVPPRRSILGDPATCSSAPVFSTNMVTTTAGFNGPSILDRTGGLLDRTEAEKQNFSSTVSAGGIHGAPLLPNPTPDYDQGVILTGAQQRPFQQHGNGECVTSGRRVLLDRSRTTSPHSVHSSTSPGSSVWNEDGQSKFRNVPPNVGMAAPVRPGLLDRLTPPAPILNGATESWVSILCRTAADASPAINSGLAKSFREPDRDYRRGRSDSRSSSRSRSDIGRRGSEKQCRRSRLPIRDDGNGDWRSRSPGKRKSHSRSRSSGRRIRSRKRSRSLSSTHRSARIKKNSTDARDEVGGQERVKSSILDRSAEEKEVDASLRATATKSVGSGSKVLPDAGVGVITKEEGGGQSQGEVEAKKSGGNEAESENQTANTKNEENEASRPPRIPAGYRRMCVMVSRLLPLELKLVSNWRYCKFVAESPRVHLTRLPNEVVEAIQRRYAMEDEQKKKEHEEKKEKRKASEQMQKEEPSKFRRLLPTLTATETAPQTGSKRDKEKPQVAKRRMKPLRQPSDPESAPFLNIPGMPSMESLWSFKIKKKTPAESSEETSKKRTSGTGSWQRPPAKSLRLVSDPKSSRVDTSNKRHYLETLASDSLKSQTEYISPLMRAEAENAAKRARVDQQYGKRSIPRSPKVESTTRSTPMLPQPSGSGVIDSISGNRNNLDVMSVSPALSSSSRSSFWTDTSGAKGPTSPPAAVQHRERRTLLGAAPTPLLPTPIIGPRTPPHPPPETTSSRYRGGPLLGDQPPLLPNWVPDPPRNGSLQAPAPLLYNETPPSAEKQFTEPDPSAQVTMPDGTIFDPMIFLNRDSDYSSDSDTPAPVADTEQTTDRTKENQLPGESVRNSPKVDKFVKTEAATIDDHWPAPDVDHHQTEDKSKTDASTAANATAAAAKNVDLESEAEMAILALRLVARLERNATTEPSRNDPMTTPQASNSTPRVDEDDDPYDVSHLRNIIQLFLDDPSSILQTDQGRRRKAMELLPILDALDAFARMQPNAITSAMTMPIMQFVHEVVELSSPCIGVPAATAERESGIISHTVVKNESTTNPNRSTPV